ncbi:MAG: ABC transporter substrate-binding protein [Ilumatobacter sp.]
MTRKTLAGLIAGLTLVAACASDPEPVAEPATEPAPTTTEAEFSEPEADPPAQAEAEATEEAVEAESEAEAEPEETYPSRIVSLSPTATEMLYAIGAGDQVIAVDDFSNYPAETADKMPGISGYDPNVEAILALEPDLIVTEGSNSDLIEQIERVGIAHWAGPAAVGLDDVYAQIEQLGAATGHLDTAVALTADMATRVDAVLARIAELDNEPLSYYHELDPTYYSVTSETFIGTVYRLLGLVNIADAIEEESYGYPQLSAEFILDADPDLIFLACTKYCGETFDTVAARPGWDTLAAVANGNVIELDDDIASRWGPRIVDHIEQVVDAVDTVVAGAAAAA